MSIFLKVSIVNFDPISNIPNRSSITSELMNTLDKLRIDACIRDLESTNVKDLRYPTEIDLRGTYTMHKVNEFPTLYLQMELNDLKNEGLVCIIKELYNAIHSIPAMKNLIYFANNLAAYIYKELTDIDTDNATYVYLDIYRLHLYTQGNMYAHDVDPLKLPSGMMLRSNYLYQLTDTKDIMYVCDKLAVTIQLAHTPYVVRKDTLEILLELSMRYIEFSREYIVIGTELPVLLYVSVAELLNAYTTLHTSHKLCMSCISKRDNSVKVIELGKNINLSTIIPTFLNLVDKLHYKYVDTEKASTSLPEFNILITLLHTLFNSIFVCIRRETDVQEGLLLTPPTYPSFLRNTITTLLYDQHHNWLLYDVLLFIYSFFIQDSALDPEKSKRVQVEKMDTIHVLEDALLNTLYFINSALLVPSNSQIFKEYVGHMNTLVQLDFRIVSALYLILWNVIPKRYVGIISIGLMPTIKYQSVSENIRIFPYYSVTSAPIVDLDADELSIFYVLYYNKWKEKCLK